MSKPKVNVHVRAKVSAVGAIGIPAVVRRELNINPGTYVYFSIQADGTVLVIPESRVVLNVHVDTPF